jgi:ABC-2 type transport system ATP-binding protein
MIEVLSEFRTHEKTVIFSTHLMETAERLCHDILLINKAEKVFWRELAACEGKLWKEPHFAQGRELWERSRGPLFDLKAESHADEIEVHLKDGTDPQQLLVKLLEGGARIDKFERVEPSLNDIFIEKVTNV